MRKPKDEAQILEEIMEFLKSNEYMNYYRMKAYAFNHDKHRWLALLQNSPSACISIHRYAEDRRHSLGLPAPYDYAQSVKSLKDAEKNYKERIKKKRIEKKETELLSDIQTTAAANAKNPTSELSAEKTVTKKSINESPIDNKPADTPIKQENPKPKIFRKKADSKEPANPKPIAEIANPIEEEPKPLPAKRGRPKKSVTQPLAVTEVGQTIVPTISTTTNKTQPTPVAPTPKKRGRPKKVVATTPVITEPVSKTEPVDTIKPVETPPDTPTKRRRGRPKKVVEQPNAVTPSIEKAEPATADPAKTKPARKRKSKKISPEDEQKKRERQIRIREFKKYIKDYFITQ